MFHIILAPVAFPRIMLIAGRHVPGEKPIETKLAPTWALRDIARHAVDFWLSTEDLPRRPHDISMYPAARSVWAGETDKG